MGRPVRISIIAISVILVLFAMQVGVLAKKKKSSKRKSRAPRNVSVVFRGLPVIVTPPVLSSAAAGSMYAPGLQSSSASSAPATPTGSGIGDTDGGSKRIWKILPQTPAAGGLIISEFRLTGNGGVNDEFIEIYNDFGSDHTVSASSGTGYSVAASDGIVRCIIPNGIVIPARGHFLCVNPLGYSLSTYPSGNNGVSVTTATGDDTYITGITDGEDTDGVPGPPFVPAPRQGIALFNTTLPANFNLANRFDAVGPTEEANTLYKEGAGLPNLTAFSVNQAWVRDECGKGGSITTLGPCTISTPKDTDNNAADFFYVDTNGTSAGAAQHLGAPGPQNLTSAIQRNSSITENLIDNTIARSNPPNRVRDFTSDPGNNSTFGTLSLRRRFVNNTGASITYLRFRIIDLTTFLAPSGTADLRPRNSSAVVINGINDAATCAATGAPATPPCAVSLQGTTLDTPPSQPNGGGFNTSLTAGTVTLLTPLPNGASINLQFLLGIELTGSFKVYVNVEALP